MRNPMTRILATVLTVGLLGLPASLQACSACFGKSDSPMAQGMNMGIFTLLLFILSVLIGIAVFFAYIIRRAARLEAANLPAHLEASASPESAPAREAQSI